MKNIKRTCPICNIKFIDTSRSKNKFTCSNKCRREYYYQQNPDAYKNMKLRLRLNILRGQDVIVTPEDIQDIREKISLGKCQICGKVEDDTKRLHIDHCHTTNQYRNLICQTCNFTVGYIEKHPDSVSLCQDYIEKHNARLGVGDNYIKATGELRTFADAMCKAMV